MGRRISKFLHLGFVVLSSNSQLSSSLLLVNNSTLNYEECFWGGRSDCWLFLSFAGSNLGWLCRCVQHIPYSQLCEESSKQKVACLKNQTHGHPFRLLCSGHVGLLLSVGRYSWLRDNPRIQAEFWRYWTSTDLTMNATRWDCRVKTRRMALGVGEWLSNFKKTPKVVLQRWTASDAWRNLFVKI